MLLGLTSALSHDYDIPLHNSGQALGLALGHPNKQKHKFTNTELKFWHKYGGNATILYKIKKAYIIKKIMLIKKIHSSRK